MLRELLYNFRDIVMGPHLDERRSIARARCSLSLSCQTPDGARVCILKDISVQGARLLTDQRWRRGLKVTIMPPKGMGGQEKGLKAKVAWARPVRGEYQVGLKFLSGPSGSWVSKILRELGLSTQIPRQRRKWIRVPGDVKIRYSAHGFDKSALLQDLSIGGALLTCNDRVSKNIPIRLSLPAGNDVPALDLPGKTCSCKKSEGGAFDVSVEFDDLQPKQRKVLVKHLSDLMRRALSR